MEVLKVFRHEYKFVIPYEEMLSCKERTKSQSLFAKQTSPLIEISSLSLL